VCEKDHRPHAVDVDVEPWGVHERRLLTVASESSTGHPVRRARTLVPLGTALCLLGLVAGCGSNLQSRRSASTSGRPDTWIVVRDPSSARRSIAPAAPALAVRPAGLASAPEVLPLVETRIAVTAVGPIATIERTKVYTTSQAGTEAFVSFTPPAAPTNQDWTVRVGNRALAILVRERNDAQAIARDETGVSIVSTDADGRAVIPVGALGTPSAELGVETTGLVPWHDGAYELDVPRVPSGEVSFTADVYGPGPIVVVSSPSHAIDAAPESLAHLRVGLREPGTLRDADFVLRYRVDPRGHPGAVVVAPDGAGEIVGLVVHPFEDAHVPVAVSDVTIDWNGAAVTDVRPADLGRVAAGTPLVVLARAHGTVAGPVTVRVRVGKNERTITLVRDEAVPRAGLRALPLLWARAGHVATVTARR
jgi:hypothetical protein